MNINIDDIKLSKSVDKPDVYVTMHVRCCFPEGMGCKLQEELLKYSAINPEIKRVSPTGV